MPEHWKEYNGSYLEKQCITNIQWCWLGLGLLFLKCCLLFYSLTPLYHCYYSHKINHYSHPNSHYSQQLYMITSCQKVHDIVTGTITLKMYRYMFNNCTVVCSKLYVGRYHSPVPHFAVATPYFGDALADFRRNRIL